MIRRDTHPSSTVLDISTVRFKHNSLIFITVLFPYSVRFESFLIFQPRAPAEQTAKRGEEVAAPDLGHHLGLHDLRAARVHLLSQLSAWS